MTKPTISILLPARGRPKNLSASIESLRCLANDPSAVEVLVALDDDDHSLQDEVEILRCFDVAGVFNQVAFECGQRLGYSKMHEYYNRLAAASSGDWLVIWNDDIEMVTRGWDVLLIEAPKFTVQFPRRDTVSTTDYTLPVIERLWYERLGHLSLNAYCDAWISDVSAFAGTSVVRDDVVFVHHRLNDTTLLEQSGNNEWEKFVSEDQRALRRLDMKKILSAPDHEHRFNGFEVEAVYHDVDHINLMSKERRAQSFVLKKRRSQ